MLADLRLKGVAASGILVGGLPLFSLRATLAPCLNANESPPEDVGIVLKVKGEWLLNGKAVVPGQRLPARGKIYHAPLKPVNRCRLTTLPLCFLMARSKADRGTSRVLE